MLFWFGFYNSKYFRRKIGLVFRFQCLFPTKIIYDLLSCSDDYDDNDNGGNIDGDGDSDEDGKFGGVGGVNS